MDPLFRNLERSPDVFTALSAIAVALAVFLFTCSLVKLWNSTLPELSGFKRLSLWQAIKITLPVGILTGGSTASFSMS